MFLTNLHSADGITVTALSVLTVVVGVGLSWFFIAMTKRRREHIRIEEDWYHPTNRI